jgi:hypothetical protein
MAPVAAAALVRIAALAVMSVIVGAFGGAGVWAVNGSVLGGGLVAVAGFLAATAVFDSYSLKAAVSLGLPALILTFLASWLMARWAGTRAGLRRIWATLIGLAGGLLLGFLCLSLYRLSFWGPSICALAVDVCLVGHLARTASRRPPVAAHAGR